MMYDSNYNTISCQYTAIWNLVYTNINLIVNNYITCVCGLECLYNAFACITVYEISHTEHSPVTIICI